MDPEEKAPLEGTEEGVVMEAGSASAAASETLLTPGQESVDTLDKGALSPLTGSYLLIVLAEPHSEEDREIIIKRLIKGLRSWDLDATHVDLTCELLNLANAAPESDEARNGEKLVQWASENLVVEVLIHCQVNTLLQCMKNLLSSFTRHRHIIHAGYTFQGSGSWILQDGTFSFTDFVELWDEPEVHRILGAYRGDISVSLHCAEENGWTDDQLGQESFTKLCQVWMNPEEKIAGHSSGIISFVDYISKMVQPAPLKEILEPSEIVGNIRFSHPTLYVFPGGQGDAALFGVNGFNMLVDGGFSRRSCFWDFTRHLDRLDAVLLTRVNNNAVAGLDSLMDRKSVSQVYPQIGHFFGNVMERRHHDSEKDTQETKSSESGDLLVSLTETGQRILDNLKNINLRPQHCFREHTIDPINLYHKVGHGKLDMYVLNPAKDSKEVREFLSKWNTDCKSFVQARMNVKVEGKEMNYPVLNLVSICALLVWQPDNPREPITRILFPGSTPQQKIFEALGKLKHLEFLKHPICSAKTLAASHKSRSKSERIVSEARSHVKTGDSVTDSAKVSRAPSESRVTSSRYSSSLYSGVRSKVSSSQRSDSSSTIQTAEEKDKQRKGRERSRDKRKVREVKDNKEIEEVKKASGPRSRVDSGLTESKTVRSRSKSKTQKSKVESTAKKSSPSEVIAPSAIGGESVPSKESTKKSSSTSRYGIHASLSSRTVVSKSSAATSEAATPPPSTPPKAAKDATNRKVVEHKAATAASSRKTTVERARETTIKDRSSTLSSKPLPAPKAKPISQRPATAKKAPASASTEKGAGPVKRPGTAKVAVAAAVGGVAAAALAAAIVTQSPEKESTELPVEGQKDEDKLAVEEGEMDKDSIEDEVIKPQTNGFHSSAASVPATESSSEMSSLEHVIDYDVEDKSHDISQQESRPGTELSEEVSGSEDIDTVESKTVAVEEITKAPESETHTITEPEEAAYEEEDEYLIIEKDESVGAEEIAVTGEDQSAPEEKAGETYDEEKGAGEEKGGEEKEENEDKKQPDEILEEETGLPEPEKARKSIDETEDTVEEQSDQIIKTGSATEVKAPEEQEITAEETADDASAVTEEEEKAPLSPEPIVEEIVSSSKVAASEAEPTEVEESGEVEEPTEDGSNQIESEVEKVEEDQDGDLKETEKAPESPPPSPDNKDGLTLDVTLENEEGPLSPASSPVKEGPFEPAAVEETVEANESSEPESKSAVGEGQLAEMEKKVYEQIDNAETVEELSHDINALEEKMDEETMARLEAKAEAVEDIAEKINVLADEDQPDSGKEEPELFENKEETLEEALHDEVVQAVLETAEEKLDELEGEKMQEKVVEEEISMKVAESESVNASKLESLKVSAEETGDADEGGDAEVVSAAEEKVEEKVDSIPSPSEHSKAEEPDSQLEQNEDAAEEEQIMEKVSSSLSPLEALAKSVESLKEPQESISPAKSTEDVKDAGAEEEVEEKASVSPAKSTEGIESISPAKSVEGVGKSNSDLLQVDKDDDDDKHSVKSGVSEDHEDKKSVVSISPAKSVADIQDADNDKPAEQEEVEAEAETDSVKPEKATDPEEEKPSISPALSTHDLKDSEKSLPVESEAELHDDDKKSTRSASPAQSAEPEQEVETEKVGESEDVDEDKQSVKSETECLPSDKKSASSISPARSIEEVVEAAKSGELESGLKSTGSVSPAKSVESIPPPEEEQVERKLSNAGSEAPADEEKPSGRKPSTASSDVIEEKEENRPSEITPETEIEPVTEQFDVVIESKQVDETKKLSTSSEKITDSPEPPVTTTSASPQADSTPEKHLELPETEPSGSFSGEEGRPSSSEIEFDTEILPSEALALAQIGERLITKSKKEELSSIIQSSTTTSASPKEAVTEEEEVEDDEKKEVEETETNAPEETHDKVEQETGQAEHDKLEPSKPDEPPVDEGDEDQIVAESKEQDECKEDTLEVSKLQVPQDESVSKTDENVPEEPVEEKVEKDTMVPPQKAELSLGGETDNDPSAVFSPGDSIRTEELDLALEEHRRRLSAANSQAIDIMGNMSEDKVDIETSRESQFGSVNEEDIDEDLGPEDEEADDEEQKLHFKSGEELCEEEAQTPIVQPQAADFPKEKSPEKEAKVESKVESEERNGNKRPVPSAIPSSKFPRESKELIRTPDEVAELPMHEEVDPGTYKEDEDEGESGKEEEEEVDETEESTQLVKEQPQGESEKVKNAEGIIDSDTGKSQFPEKSDEKDEKEEIIDSAVEKGEEKFHETVEAEAVEGEKRAEEEEADKQLPGEQEAMTMSVVEKIDAAVSPVLESLLNKTVEKSLEEEPSPSDVRESGETAGITSAMSASAIEPNEEEGESDGQIEKESGPKTQINAGDAISTSVTGDHDGSLLDVEKDVEKEEEEDEKKECSSPIPPQMLTMKPQSGEGSGAPTSVVITPCTPPVIPTTTNTKSGGGVEGFDYSASALTTAKEGESETVEVGQPDQNRQSESHEGENEEVVEGQKEETDDKVVKDHDDEDDKVSSTQDADVKESVSKLSAPTATEERSDESSTSSALTAVAAAASAKLDETSTDKTTTLSDTEGGDDAPKKLFFLPRDDDDEGEDGSGEAEEKGEEVEPEDDVIEIDSSIPGVPHAVELGLLTAANTLSAAVVHQSPESIAHISHSPEPEIGQPQSEGGKSDGGESTTPPPVNTDEEEKEEEEIKQPQEAGGGDSGSPKPTDEAEIERDSGEDKAPLNADSEEKGSGESEILRHHKECYEDLQQLAKVDSSQPENDSALADAQNENFIESQKEEEGEIKSPKSPKTAEVDFNLDTARSDKPNEEAIKLGEELVSTSINVASSLLETAESAVSSVVEIATETVEVAHSTVEEVEKSAIEKVDNLLHDEKITQKTTQVSESCTSSSCVTGVEDKICEAMSSGGKQVCDHHHDDEKEAQEEKPGVVEDVCVKTAVPKPVIPDKFYEEIQGEEKVEEEVVHLVVGKGLKSPSSVDSSQTKVETEQTPEGGDDEVASEIEQQIISDDTEQLPAPVEKGDKGTPEQVKSPIAMDVEESSGVMQDSQSRNNMQLIEEEERKPEQKKKRKKLSDFASTIREAKAVFDNLLKVAKSGAALSSAVDECRVNAQEAIRRHLEAADEVYRPANNKDPEYMDVPDSPEPEVGVTVYENLEQMAKAGSELFTGLVEKVEKEEEEKARREAENSSTPEEEEPEEEGEETDGPNAQLEERRSSAELAVTAALQHLHETFKTMQTMGSSPKRSSSAAARRMRCHHHHHEHDLVPPSLVEGEDDESASSAIFSTGAGSLQLSASGGGSSTLKSPDDGSEGETMRESLASFAESGVASQSDADDAVKSQFAPDQSPGENSAIDDQETPKTEEDDQPSPKSKSEDTVMTASFIAGSDVEHTSEKIEKSSVESESNVEETTTDSGHILSASESTTKTESTTCESSTTKKSETPSSKIEEEASSQTQFEEKTSESSQSKKEETPEKVEHEEMRQSESHSYSSASTSEALSSIATIADSEGIGEKVSSSSSEAVTTISNVATSSSSSQKSEQFISGKSEVESITSQMDDNFLSRYEDSAAQMYKEELSDGNFRRFSSVEPVTPEKEIPSASDAQSKSGVLSDVGYQSQVESDKASDSFKSTPITKKDEPSGQCTTTTVVKTITSDDGKGGTTTVIETVETKQFSSGSSGPFSIIETQKESQPQVTTIVTSKTSSDPSSTALISGTAPPAVPHLQEEEPYSSGDFTDSQPSSIPTTQAETDDEVNNFTTVTKSSMTKGDIDNGNYSTVTTTTSTISSQQIGDSGNLNTASRAAEISSSDTTTQSSGTSSTTTSTASTSRTAEEILKEWGKPLGLPVLYTEGENGGGAAAAAATSGSGTPKKVGSGVTTSSKSGTPAKTGTRRTSSRKTSRHSPIYVDLAYVPHHGNSHYCDSEFFRMVRARYYVFSGLEPSREVFEGLLQGKQQWEDKNLETTIIPTYDTDTLGYWVVDSEKDLAEAKIDLAPSASRCTINLQDHETSCAAYRLEF